MVTQSAPVSREDIAAALDWWRLAGMDVDAVDEAAGWLDAETKPAAADATAKPAAQARPKPKAPPPRAPGADLAGLAAVPGDGETWPATLAEFQAWWVDDKNFSPAGAYPKVAPRGVAQAELMILLPQPEDSDADALLAGPEGALLKGFMRAAGLAEQQVYFASVLPRHTLRPDWSEVEAAGYGKLAAHHVALAAPKRLVVFGRDILPLLPHESAQDSANLRNFNHESGSIPLLSARDVANLRRRSGFRARFWQQWLEFSGS